MTAQDDDESIIDLIRRTEAAARQIAGIALDIGVTFRIGDIVQRVEDELPADYPNFTNGDGDRRDVIALMARDIFSGEMYRD